MSDQPVDPAAVFHSALPTGTSLIVVFVSRRDRDGQPIDQDHWVDEVLATLGLLFRGATAYPRGRGVWRDDERGGTLVTVGGTTGFEVALNLLPVFADQLTITGSIMGTLEDMEIMVRLIAQAGIEPEIGVVLPMERADEGFRAMWEGRTHGKTVFIR